MTRRYDIFQKLDFIHSNTDVSFVWYLVPRGEAYDKKYKEKLREDDK